ncbi:hypothetical protein MUK42_19184 [Musa troglodytarum]|uniref:Uncharacterized protein n=1 Tax=Musa troglodytarum TaxID=320322 RepID=A0A9E7K938_9LILI|nr:hypothetical protein MUK42_19184 [Musa troglodytarum]
MLPLQLNALQGIRGTCEQKIFVQPVTPLVPLLIAAVAVRVHLAAKWLHGTFIRERLIIGVRYIPIVSTIIS